MANLRTLPTQVAEFRSREREGVSEREGVREREGGSEGDGVEEDDGSDHWGRREEERGYRLLSLALYWL